MSAKPPILEGCDVLPPMERPKGQGHRTAKVEGKGKPKGRRGRAGDRFKVINTFADFAMRELNRAQIAVWVLLWRDTRDGLARTSQADLARRAGVSERTVGRAVRTLHRAGLLTVVHRGGPLKGPSTYRVHPLPREPT